MSDQMHVRSFTVRDFNEETRTFKGIAVPWNKPVQIRDWFGSYTEQFERGSVTVPDQSKVLVCYRHGEEIGRLTKHEDREDGWYVEGRISETARGNDAYVLLRDGVTEELSIGFLPVRHEMDDDTGDITRTEVLAREVSLVPFGAYGADAKVSEVRAADQTTDALERSTGMDTTEKLAEEVTELRSSMEELGRSFTAFSTRGEEPQPADTRTAGEILQALARGDEATINRYNEMQRAYTGGTTADAPIKDGWVGDLTRIFDASTGVLGDVFSTGSLPATGMNIEFAELATNTVQVTEQENEGDDLAYGKVTLRTRTAEVKTYGGYVQLTRQQIERSTLPILNRSLEALAMAAGVRKKAELRAAYLELATERTTAGDTIEVPTVFDAGDWLDAVVDAAVNFEAKGAGIDALIVSPTVFKDLNKLETTGHRVFRVDGHERTSGELDLTALKGDIASLRVVCDTGATGSTAVFANGRALRQYDSALVSLQDENIINLSKDFSVYRYGAIAAEIPGFLVPVEFAE